MLTWSAETIHYLRSFDRWNNSHKIKKLCILVCCRYAYIYIYIYIDIDIDIDIDRDTDRDRDRDVYTYVSIYIYSTSITCPVFGKGLPGRSQSLGQHCPSRASQTSGTAANAS